jgi:hypothetical protein
MQIEDDITEEDVRRLFKRRVRLTKHEVVEHFRYNSDF